MKRDFRPTLKTLSGKDLMTEDTRMEGDNEVKFKRPMTLAHAAVTALQIAFPDEKPELVEKMRRFKLAQRIHDAPGPVDVDAEEVALIKALIVKIYPPLVVGRSVELLEAEAVPGGAALRLPE